MTDAREGPDGRADPQAPRARPDVIAALAELSRSTTESTSTMEGLVEQVRRDADARELKIQVLERNLSRMQRLQNLVLVGLAGLLILGVFSAISLNQARRNALVTANIARDSQGTYGLLADCLDQVHGTCGKRTAAQTAAVLAQIKQYELTVIFCARSHPSVDDRDGAKFTTCVNTLYPGGPQLPPGTIPKGRAAR